MYLKKRKMEDLKNECRIKKIRGYSKLKKEELIKCICAVKIQRWLKKKCVVGEMCPISGGDIKYPYFTYLTKNNKKIYYNLPVLREYLINTGTFIEPTTREKMSVEVLEKIDREFSKSKSDSVSDSVSVKIGNTPAKTFKTVMSAYRDKNFYKRKKYIERDILEYESIISYYIEDIISSIFNGSTDTWRTLNRYFNDHLGFYNRIIDLDHHYDVKYMISKSNSTIMSRYEEAYNCGGRIFNLYTRLIELMDTECNKEYIVQRYWL